MTLKLASNQRRFLKSMANRLKATVWIGKQGLSAEVVSAINQALETNELLKIKILESSPIDRKAIAGPLEEATGCAVVQVVGRVVTIFRPFKEKPQIKLPTPS